MFICLIQVAVIAGNMELGDVIKNHSIEDVGKCIFLICIGVICVVLLWFQDIMNHITIF